MFLLLVSAAAVLQQAPPDLPNITELKALPPAGCRVQAPIATADAAPPGGKKLTELPPAREYHTVLRSVRGCDFAEVRSAPQVGPNGVVTPGAWVWEPTGPGQLDRALPTGGRIKRPNGR